MAGATMEAADAELEEVTRRLCMVLRARHPELFDSMGRLHLDAYAQSMLLKTGGRETLTGEDILELEGDVPAHANGLNPGDAP
jgi:hypothetical protein